MTSVHILFISQFKVNESKKIHSFICTLCDIYTYIFICGACHFIRHFLPNNTKRFFPLFLSSFLLELLLRLLQQCCYICRCSKVCRVLFHFICNEIEMRQMYHYSSVPFLSSTYLPTFVLFTFGWTIDCLTIIIIIIMNLVMAVVAEWNLKKCLNKKDQPSNKVGFCDVAFWICWIQLRHNEIIANF